MIVPRLTIHKWKRKFFALVSISLCLPLHTPIFHKIKPRFLKSSGKRYSGGTRRSSGSWSNWKKQQSYIRLSMQLRKQRGKQRSKPKKRPKNRGLWRRRRSWSISNNSGTRC